MSGTELERQPDIVTARMRLRRLRRRDAALIALYSSDRRVGWATSRVPHPYPPGAAEALIERATAPGATELYWALDTGDDDENGLIGVIALRPKGEGAGQVGYWVAPAFWNTGYAGEAVEGLIGWAAEHDWRELTAEVFQDNPASARVLTRAGFDYEGEGETYSLARDTMVPSFLYRRRLA